MPSCSAANQSAIPARQWSRNIWSCHPVTGCKLAAMRFITAFSLAGPPSRTPYSPMSAWASLPPTPIWSSIAARTCSSTVSPHHLLQLETGLRILVQWINENIAYQPQATTIETTAAEVMQSRQGVCQDFAHLMIALCRRQGIPARYVNGFLVGEGETHAWVEIFDGYNWLGFDPTHNCRISNGYVKLAHGRDARDCSVSRGMYTGQASQQTTIHVTLHEI